MQPKPGQPLTDIKDPLGIRLAELGFRVLFTFYGFVANLLGALNGLRRER